jgi:sodium-dependent dicarboxylate transporter 2/3/5
MDPKDTASGIPPAASAEPEATRSSVRNRVGLWLGPILFVAVWALADLDPEAPSATAMAAVAVLMGVWWVTEAIPIPATALLPIVLFPLTGIMKSAEVAREYASWLIFLFLGGFLIAIAVERWNLHKRIALHILRVIGGRPRRLVLGVMAATAFLSMWLSNTATTMMMLPIALSFVALQEDFDRRRRETGAIVDPRSANFGLVLMLGLAHSASIGGVATLIGTPPNGVLVTQFAQIFPEAPAISFAQWMAFAFPFSALFLLVAWLLLCRVIFPLPASSPFSGRELIRAELRRLGPISTEERRVAFVFAGVALLWMTRKDMPLGASLTLPGWSSALDAVLTRLHVAPVGALVDDSTVSVLMALLLFAIPASRERGGRLMDWDAAKGVPWGILVLFGGGLALAAGFEVSGLSAWIGARFESLAGAPPVAMVMSIVAVVAGLTELTSNTATASMALPIMASLARAIEVNPLLLMVPAALAASCAFALPVATPPNAIVYGSGRLTITQMIKAGIVMNLVAVVLITVLIFTLGATTFDVTGAFPPWAAGPS